MLENLPKINIGLSVLVVVCFFMPWISIDCGNVTLIKLSGFELATGKISLSEDLVKAMGNQLGEKGANLHQLDQRPDAKPQFYLFAILISAVSILGYSIKNISEQTRAGYVAVMVLSGAAILVLVAAALLDYGIDIPPNGGMFIDVSAQIGYYGTIIAFLASASLSFVWLRFGSSKPRSTVQIDIPIQTPPVMTEDLSGNVLPPTPPPSEDHFLNVFEFPQEHAQEQQRPAVPTGMKACPTCGNPVGPYQAKCIKCGSKLKPSK